MSSDNHVNLTVSDGDVIQLPFTMAKKLAPISTLLEDLGDDCVNIPLHNVHRSTLEHIILLDEFDNDETLYLSHGMDALSTTPIQNVIQILTEANFLGHELLIKACSRSIGARIESQNPSPHEIRKMFGIENDFTRRDREMLLERYPELR